jgi:hypothetical protein
VGGLIIGFSIRVSEESLVPLLAKCRFLAVTSGSIGSISTRSPGFPKAHAAWAAFLDTLAVCSYHFFYMK